MAMSRVDSECMMNEAYGPRLLFSCQMQLLVGLCKTLTLTNYFLHHEPKKKT